MVGSPRFQLNLTDWKRIGRNFILAGIATVLVQLPLIQEALEKFLEQNTENALVISVATAAIIWLFDFVRRILTDYTPKFEGKCTKSNKKK